MEINHQAPLVSQKEMFIQASPEEIWRIHTAINDWPQWQPTIGMANLDGPLATGSIFQWKSGGLTITSTVQVVEPNRKVGWTGKALGTRASHIWIFKPHNGGTMLATEESMEGWLISILKLIMPKFLEESLDTWLQSLKSKAESSSSAG
jgi:uncharacterized protein YndB with AHSA1/START domain